MKKAPWIDPGDAAAPCAQGLYVYHRDGDLPPGLELLGGNVGDSIFNERDVRAGPSHVEAYDPGLTDELAVAGGAAHTARGAG